MGLLFLESEMRISGFKAVFSSSKSSFLKSLDLRTYYTTFAFFFSFFLSAEVWFEFLPNEGEVFVIDVFGESYWMVNLTSSLLNEPEVFSFEVFKETPTIFVAAFCPELKVCFK